MRFFKNLRAGFDAWRQKQLTAIRSDIRCCEEMIRQCNAELTSCNLGIEAFNQRVYAIGANEARIERLRGCERFFGGATA